MPTKEINIIRFTGMNDVKTSEGFFVEEGVAEPCAILNADVDIKGGLVKRSGKTKLVALEGAHSLWAGNYCMLCAAKGILYRIYDTQATALCAIEGVELPLSYVEVDRKIYISNTYWKIVYSPDTEELSSWGQELPPGPMLLSADGGLPAGTYHVCMTNVRDGEVSGNGPISTIELTGVGGIAILNRPANAVVWCTDQNEGIFYRVGAVNKIVNQPTVEPLPSFMCSAPLKMNNLCSGFGRLWGSVGKDVYYSQPFMPSLYNTKANKFSFDSEVTMIAKVETGLFVGTVEKTYFLDGTEPAKMRQLLAGTGAIKGTLAYCNNMPELSDVLGTHEKGYTDVPVWRTLDGIVAGNVTGRLFNLTKDKVTLDVVEEGASLYRNVHGTLQYITSAKIGKGGSSVGFLSDETEALFRAGKVSRSEFSHVGQGSTQSFTDQATLEVNAGYYGRNITDGAGLSDTAEISCVLAGSNESALGMVDEVSYDYTPAP